MNKTAKYIEKICKEKGWSQVKLASIIHATPKTISTWKTESNEKRRANDQAQLILEYLSDSEKYKNTTFETFLELKSL